MRAVGTTAKRQSTPNPKTGAAGSNLVRAPCPGRPPAAKPSRAADLALPLSSAPGPLNSGLKQHRPHVCGGVRDLAQEALGWTSSERGAARDTSLLHPCKAGHGAAIAFHGRLASGMASLFGHAGLGEVHSERHEIVVRRPDALDRALGLRDWAALAAERDLVSRAETRSWEQSLDPAKSGDRFRYSFSIVITAAPMNASISVSRRVLSRSGSGCSGPRSRTASPWTLAQIGYSMFGRRSEARIPARTRLSRAAWRWSSGVGSSAPSAAGWSGAANAVSKRPGSVRANSR